MAIAGDRKDYRNKVRAEAETALASYETCVAALNTQPAYGTALEGYVRAGETPDPHALLDTSFATPAFISSLESYNREEFACFTQAMEPVTVIDAAAMNGLAMEYARFLQGNEQVTRDLGQVQRSTLISEYLKLRDARDAVAMQMLEGELANAQAALDAKREKNAERFRRMGKAMERANASRNNDFTVTLID